MKVREIMVTELVTLHVDEELSLASDIMNLARIRHLPIVEGEKLELSASAIYLGPLWPQ